MSTTPPSAGWLKVRFELNGRAAMSRLDQELVQRGLCDSREKARRAVLAGKVRVNGQRAQKPSDSIREADRLSIDEPERYVSRGGFKLEEALKKFSLRVEGLTALDLGASTGGFTDCLLQHGAARIYAVDVGHGQLAWTLRQDPRVVVMEKTNARQLTLAHFPPGFLPVDLVVIDCSFISVEKLIPAAASLLGPGGKMIVLLKPQFEAGKEEVDRGRGVITDTRIHERVLQEFENFIRDHGKLCWRARTESPILGPAGNKEFLILLEKPSIEN